MSRFRFSCIVTLFCLSAVSRAQFTHQFTNTARNTHYGSAYGVAVGSDGTVFLANETDGLRAYTYDGTAFSNTAHIDDGGHAWGVAVGSDGTVFLANERDGLRAYTYDGTSFTNTAHIDDGGYAFGVAVGSDGTVFLANADEGMFAYTYSEISGIDHPITAAPEDFSLSQNYPNPFNPSTTIFYSLKKTARVSLRIYDLQGRELKTLVDDYQGPGTFTVLFDASDFASGIYYYRLQINNGVTETKKMMLLK